MEKHSDALAQRLLDDGEDSVSKTWTRKARLAFAGPGAVRSYGAVLVVFWGNRSYLASIGSPPTMLAMLHLCMFR